MKRSHSKKVAGIQKQRVTDIPMMSSSIPIQNDIELCPMIAFNIQLER
jgi:hypothetical protein